MLDKLRRCLDWTQRIVALIDLVKLLFALGLGATVRTMLATRIPSVWLTPIWLLSSGVILWLLTRFVGAKPKRSDRSDLDCATKPDELCEALKRIANTDAEKISERVQEISQRIEFHFVPGSEPSVDVITELWNSCVFDLVNFGEISGHVTYGGRQLAADPRIIDSVEPVLLSLRHGGHVTLVVRQYLSAEMADMMEANRNRQVTIDFGNVAVLFQSAPLAGFSKQSFRWFGPRFAIEDTRRVF